MSQELYKTEREKLSADDASRARWTLQQWRAYFLEEVTDVRPGTRVTDGDVLQMLGPQRGGEILDKVEQRNKHVFRRMTAEGADLTHSDAPAFLQAMSLTAEEQATVSKMLTVTEKRHVLMGLPDPRESFMED